MVQGIPDDSVDHCHFEECEGEGDGERVDEMKVESLVCVRMWQPPGCSVQLQILQT